MQQLFWPPIHQIGQETKVYSIILNIFVMYQLYIYTNENELLKYLKSMKDVSVKNLHSISITSCNVTSDRYLIKKLDEALKKFYAHT